MAKKYRTPNYTDLPYGFRVWYKGVTREEMLAQHQTDADGLWDGETNTIYYVKSLPSGRKRWVVGHELDHARTDWVHWGVNRGIMVP